MIPVYSPIGVDGAVDVSRSIARVTGRHRYILGPEVEEFERRFADYCGVSDCVAVANGTDALEIALRALELGPTPRVATVANAGGYATTAIHAVGGTPVYVDIDPVSMTMSAAALDELDPAPDAVVVTHLYGRAAAIADLLRIADAAKTPLIEDCAQAHGAVVDGKRVGSFGTLACFSFYPTKNLPAIGDAGAVVTGSGELAARVRTLRQYGWSAKYTVEMLNGRNSRMDEIQAAVLNDRLPFLEAWNKERREIARHYSAALASAGCPEQSTGNDYVAHLYVIRSDDRDALRRTLSERGVGTDVHYPFPDHLQPAFARTAAVGTLPETERACREVVSLPCFPGMTEHEVEQVANAVVTALKSRAP